MLNTALNKNHRPLVKYMAVSEMYHRCLWMYRKQCSIRSIDILEKEIDSRLISLQLIQLKKSASIRHKQGRQADNTGRLGLAGGLTKGKWVG
jgi:hypothetical protein